MSKYAPLTIYLRRQPTQELKMTFGELEKVIGAKLPPAAQKHRAWWSNNPSNNVMTKAWLEAGFQSEQVDMEGRKLVFRRLNRVPPPPEPSRSLQEKGVPHPLFGALRGLFRVAPNASLTAPADPEWGERK